MIENRVVLNAGPDAPYTPAYIGKYIYEYSVGVKKRRVIMYIPDGVKACCAGVYLFPPSGMSAEEFLEKSNWTEIADTEEHREKMLLFVFEAFEGGKWILDEPYEAAQGELEYIWKAYEISVLGTGVGQDISCVYDGKRYIVGYGDGGTIASKFAMWDPADIGGLVTVDAPQVEKSYIDAASKDLCSRLCCFVDDNCSKGIRKGEVPVRAWIISAEDRSDTPETLHWRNSCLADSAAEMVDMDTWKFCRSKPLEHPLDEDIKAFETWVTKTEKPAENLGYLWNRKIWKKFLCRAARWASNPGGCLRLTKDPVDDLGMIYRYEVVDGWLREWYVHIPEKVKANPGTKAPLVIVPHGFSCTGEIAVLNTNWHEVADKYGFVVIYPTALNGLNSASSTSCPLPAWNIYGEDTVHPSDIDFMMHIYKDACAKYNVDTSRVFMSGTSMGSHMTFAMALKYPEIFAAVAPTSGIIHMPAGDDRLLRAIDYSDRREVDLPIWMFGGEMEPWLLNAIPAPDNGTGKTIYTWWELNRMPEAKPVDFSGSVKTMGRWNDLTFFKNEIPMIKWTSIDYYPHGTNPEMSYRIWEEFFSKFKRDKNGKVIYQKKSF